MPEYQLVRRRIDNYLRWRFHFVEGCMRRIDALIFRELISAQVQRQVSGSLVEIGVHFGRSFFVLASGRSASEKSLAIDLFENDALYTGRPGLGRSVGFFRNCRKLGFQLSEAEVLKGSSLQVTPNEIRCRVGPVRFFSIDGGHMYEHVANDLFLAQKLMVPGGIISVDDFSTPLWPEVPIATFDWLRLAPCPFVPFLATKDKLYLCTPEYVSLYTNLIARNPGLHSSLVRKISLLGHQVLVLDSPIISRTAELLVSMLISAARRLSLPKTQLAPVHVSTPHTREAHAASERLTVPAER